MRKVRTGLWHWEAPHPEWGPGDSSLEWDRQEVSSYAIDDGDRLLLFDPLAPAERDRSRGAHRSSRPRAGALLTLRPTAVPHGQIDLVVEGVRSVLGPELIGAYLHGSAALGGLGPHSDIDIFGVSRRPTTPAEKRRLVDHLLAVSLRPRPVEVTIVVESDIRPWRYPPAFDFQYGDWWRDSFERGDLEPWSSTTSPDLASLVTMVLLGDRALVGPPAAQVFDPVPRGDYVDSLARGVGGLLDDLDWDTRNVILTLARIWSGIATGDVHSKPEAAEWALERLPREHRQVLERARAIHLGDEEDRWDDVRPQVRAYVNHVAAEIDRIRPAPGGRRRIG